MNPRLTSPRHILSLGIAVLAPLVLAIKVRAEVRGALETFTSQNNANSWLYVDFSDPDRTLRDPLWNRDPARSNPEIYARYNGPGGFVLSATAASSFGAFAGNFAAARVSGIACGVFVEDFEHFAFADVVLFSNATNTFYYSDNLGITSSGWTSVYADFKEDTWFIQDAESGFFIPTELTDAILSNIFSTSVRFFPNSAAADGEAGAIDAFYLVPDFALPEVDLTILGNESRLTFDVLLGQSYTIRESGSLLDFQPVAGQIGITGQGAHIFNAPLAPNAHYFKVESEFMPIELPDVGP